MFHQMDNLSTSYESKSEEPKTTDAYRQLRLGKER